MKALKHKKEEERLKRDHMHICNHTHADNILILAIFRHIHRH